MQLSLEAVLMIVGLLLALLGVAVLVIHALHGKIEAMADFVANHIEAEFQVLESKIKHEINKSTSSIHSAVWDASFSTFPEKPETPPVSPESVN